MPCMHRLADGEMEDERGTGRPASPEPTSWRWLRRHLTGSSIGNADSVGALRQLLLTCVCFLPQIALSFPYGEKKFPSPMLREFKPKCSLGQSVTGKALSTDVLKPRGFPLDSRCNGNVDVESGSDMTATTASQSLQFLHTPCRAQKRCVFSAT